MNTTKHNITNTAEPLKPGYKKTSVGMIPEDWEVKRVKSVADVIGGGTPSTTEVKYWNGNINWFRPSEIKGKFVYKSERKISKAGLKNSSAKELPIGTILLTTRATIGEASLSTEISTTNQGFQSLVCKKGTNNVFLYELIKFNKNELYRRANGSTFLEISGKEIKQIPLAIPPLPEQKAIADCLSTWDKGIEKLSALIASKKEQKKGLMQGLFSGKLKVENGELVKVEDEKLWLKGWKEIKLKKTAKFLRGKGLSKGAVIQNGKNKCILYGELYTKYNEIISKIYSRTDSTDGLPSKKYDILIPSSTTTSGIDLITASCVLENNVLLGGDLIVMRPDLNKINAKFFVYLFSNSLHKLILRYTQGVTIIHLYGKDLKEVKLNLPSIEEQAAIAEVLITADKEIELLEKKLEAFKIEKKGLMQVLLTGERRLV